MARRKNKNKNKKNRKMRKKIYVVGSQKNYADWLLLDLVDSVEEADLVMFTGGEDVNPSLYGELVGKYTGISKTRDNYEIEVYNKCIELDKKMIGICRGGQFLTVMAGGKLIQHVNGHAGGEHSITCLWEDRRFDIDITSSHHQMFYPFNLEPHQYRLLAYSSEIRSSTYLNGDDEEINIGKDFCEPEIVIYTETKALAIQGHPEWMTSNWRTLNKLRDLVDTFLIIKNFNKNKKTEDVKN